MSVFSILLFASGIFSWPVHLMLNSPRVGEVGIMILSALLCVAACVTSVLENYWMGYIAAVAVVANRFILFAVGPVILSKLYGPELGPSYLYGVFLFLGACYNVTGYFWSWLSIHRQDGSFFMALVFSNSLAAVASIVLAYKLHCWFAKAEAANSIQETERTPLLSNDTSDA